jgi:aryl-alcohol dehydrogenase-like predicted oxidoreductase
MMRYRPLGRSGFAVSELGFGAWGIGGATPGATSYGQTDDAVSLRALEEAIARGINFFDTSAVYGYGHSEELLGRAMRHCRDRVVVATKSGLTEYGAPTDFSPQRIRTSLTESLRRLQTDYVDILQLHNPPPARIRDAADIVETIARLKDDGLIRAFGVSVREPTDGLLALVHLDPDVIQTNFNLLDQRALDSGLLDEAEAAACAIIARTPLCFGFLSGQVDERTVFAPDDHRSRWPRSQIIAWADGSREMRKHADRGQTPSQFALQFCLSFPAVTSAIPGMLRREEVVENAAASAGGALSQAKLAALRAVYVRLETMTKPADPGKIDRIPVAQSA